MSEKGLNGTCLCGNVRWEVAGENTPFAHCHCSICRKMHGTAFATYMAAGAEQLQWLSGEAEIKEFETSAGFRRRFCGKCGSTVPGIAADGHVFVPPASHEGEPGVTAKINIFVASKAPWHEITDKLRQFDTFPKGPGPKEMFAGTHSDPNAHLGGSCACGKVAFEVQTPITTVYHCHCSRCRRARSAVHATNGFTEAGGVVFTRGGADVVSYKLPDAQRFTQSFCRHCGAIMPRIDETRGIAVIPYGALDTDPGVTPQSHIYVSDRAAWHTITDDLPQYAERP